MKQENLLASNRNRSGITAALALSMLLASLGTSIANIALPTLAEAFAAPFSQVQAVVVAYLATLTVSVVMAGRLGDSFGMKTVLIGGLGLFLGASVLCGVAPNLRFLIAARAVQGVGAAFLMTLSMALMRQTSDAAHVGRAMGLLGTVSALGTALGPALGGLLIPAAGWRGIFWVQIPLAAVAMTLVVTMLPADSRKGKTSGAGLRSALSKDIAPNLIINVLVAAVMMATLVIGPFYLALGLGLEKAMVGFVMAIGPVIAIFSGIPSGRLVDKLGSARVLAIGLVLLAAGAFMLAFLADAFGVAGYVLAIVVLTPGYQLFQAANNTVTLADVPVERRGTVSGLLSLSRNIGLIAGASAMGAVFAFGAGTEDFTHAAPAAIAAGMRLAFLLAGALAVFAIMIAFGCRANARQLP